MGQEPENAGTIRKMTEKEIAELVKWGYCEHCHGPRTCVTVRSANEVRMELRCMWCDKEAE